MKTSKFTEQQIAFALKRAELGTPVEEVCRKMGISDATFYNWKKKYGGLGPSPLACRKTSLMSCFGISDWVKKPAQGGLCN